jgi:hypothetical protein
MNKPTESLLQLFRHTWALANQFRVAKYDGIHPVSNDHCFVVSMQGRNQFSKPSTKMELVP